MPVRCDRGPMRSLEAVEHLARWRGAQVGVEAAESFSCYGSCYDIGPDSLRRFVDHR